MAESRRTPIADRQRQLRIVEVRAAFSTARAGNLRGSPTPADVAVYYSRRWKRSPGGVDSEHPLHQVDLLDAAQTGSARPSGHPSVDTSCTAEHHCQDPHRTGGWTSQSRHIVAATYLGAALVLGHAGGKLSLGRTRWVLRCRAMPDRNLRRPSAATRLTHHPSNSQALHRVLGRYGDMSIPPYEPPKSAGAPNPGNTLLCPKCAGVMKTYERNGIHLEQCDTCRGIFLDFGELESLTQMENRFVQAAPPPPPPAQHGYDYGPGWGHRGNKHYRKQGFGRLFFSS